MREYGQIQCAFWEHASEEGWSSDAMLLAAYLMTGPKSNGIGCYRLTDGAIMDDLGWERGRVSETFSELFRKGFCERFGTVVLMPKFLRWNPISNGNVAKARKAEFEAIPGDDAKTAAALVLLEFGNHWEKGFIDRLETLSKGFAKGYGKQEPTQPNPTQPIETDPDGSVVPGKPATLQCPHDEIISAYHAELPMLAMVREWTPQRQALLRSRWREKPERQTVDWWRAWFAWIRDECPFLVGQGGASPGREPFLADLEWLIRPTNFAKIVEGRYARREGAA